MNKYNTSYYKGSVFLVMCLLLGYQFKNSHSVGFRTENIMMKSFCPHVAQDASIWSNYCKSLLLMEFINYLDC